MPTGRSPDSGDAAVGVTPESPFWQSKEYFWRRDDRASVTLGLSQGGVSSKQSWGRWKGPCKQARLEGLEWRSGRVEKTRVPDLYVHWDFLVKMFS